MAPQLAYLGIGTMGQAMSKNLAQSGSLEKPLILWNRTASTAHEHAEEIGNAVVSESIENAVANAEIIWSCFSGDVAVRQSFDTILNQDIKGKLFLECSTVSPEATDEVAERVIKAGAEFVTMPVFGEQSMADRALLTCLPAGRKESIQRILPYLKGVIARSVVDLSDESPGYASRLKLIGNVLVLQMVESVAEAHVLAEKTGMKAEDLHRVIQSVWPGGFEIYSKRMYSGAYFKERPIVFIDMAQKVAKHIQAIAESSGTDLEGFKIASKHLDAAREHDGDAGDISGIYGAIRIASSLPYARE